MIRHEHVRSVQVETLQSGNRDLKTREPEAKSRPERKIPVGSILAAGKQACQITTDSPTDTKQEKQDNETKLIEKNK